MNHDKLSSTIGLTVIFLSFVVTNNIFSVSAQQKQLPQCPVTKVSSPDSVYAKDTLKFFADVRGGDSKVTATYNWSVSAGTIAAGQGTATIDVDTSGVEGESTVTATVELGGFDRACGYGSTAASSTTVVMKRAEARKVDEYGKLTQKEVNTKLESFAIELLGDPTSKAYVIAYNGRGGLAAEAQIAATGARDYLVQKLGLAADKVLTREGGSREVLAIELWLVPSGAQPPDATPTSKPGVAKPTSPSRPVKP